MATVRGIRQVFLDIDGVLMLGELPIPGGTTTVNKLKSLDISVLYVTNTTRKPRRKIHEQLVKLGFHLEEDDIICPAIIAREKIMQMKRPSAALFVNDGVMEDFEGLRIQRRDVGAVVMGDLGDKFSPEILDEIFRLTFSGSSLIALQKNRFWRDQGGLRLDLGPYVAAIEYATGRRADIVGKPSPGFFRGLLERAQAHAASSLMVGDDIEADIHGAQRLGIRTVLVKTGKYDFDFVSRTEITPNAVIPSVADLPKALGIEA
ncbi:MAG: Ribonucleotide monophosphatase NagD [Calditrichaeota bacterium]|nr:Ribonucleotide monophosphatase NagD [Calditrichota bacterium]